jgi:hypothetical protein
MQRYTHDIKYGDIRLDTNGELCYFDDAEQAIADAVQAERERFRWLDASDVTEPGWYLVYGHFDGDTPVESSMVRIKESEIVDGCYSGFGKKIWGGCRFFRVPDDKGTT